MRFEFIQIFCSKKIVCIYNKGALDVVDWHVKVEDDDQVKTRTFSVDDIPWVDSNNNHEEIMDISMKQKRILQ